MTSSCWLERQQRLCHLGGPGSPTTPPTGVKTRSTRFHTASRDLCPQMTQFRPCLGGLCCCGGDPRCLNFDLLSLLASPSEHVGSHVGSAWRCIGSPVLSHSSATSPIMPPLLFIFFFFSSLVVPNVGAGNSAQTSLVFTGITEGKRSPSIGHALKECCGWNCWQPLFWYHLSVQNSCCFRKLGHRHGQQRCQKSS